MILCHGFKFLCQNRDLPKHDFFIPYMVEIVIQTFIYRIVKYCKIGLETFKRVHFDFMLDFSSFKKFLFYLNIKCFHLSQLNRY